MLLPQHEELKLVSFPLNINSKDYDKLIQLTSLLNKSYSLKLFNNVIYLFFIKDSDSIWRQSLIRRREIMSSTIHIILNIIIKFKLILYVHAPEAKSNR